MLPSGGLFKNKDKKGDKDKENRDANTPEQNGIDTEPQVISNAENEKSPKDKKEKSKVKPGYVCRFEINFYLDEKFHTL